jgi:hypothetical protein
MNKYVPANPGFYVIHYKHKRRDSEAPYNKIPIVAFDDEGVYQSLGNIGTDEIERGDIILIECPDGQTFRYFGFDEGNAQRDTEPYGKLHEAVHALSQRPDDILDGF